MISDMWKLKSIGPKSQVNIRAFHYLNEALRESVVFKVTDYQTKAIFKRTVEEYVKERNDADYNIYTTLNPIKPSAIIEERKGAKANDIDYRDLFFIDFDRAGETKNPATDEEVDAAIELAEIVQDYLTQNGWPDPIIKTMSGNGAHLYYDLDNFESTDVEKVLVKDCLKALSRQFDTEDIKIDTGVHDLARLTKWIGTVARKGKETNDRPFRTARLLT
jgi:hypothetical protein